MTIKPLAIDLFCGLGGWTDGLLAEGWDCIGFDTERHEYMVPETIPEGDGGKGMNAVEKRGWSQGCDVSIGMEGASKRPLTRLLRYPAQLVIQDVLTLHGSQFKNAALIVASPPCQAYSYRAMPWKRAKALGPPDNAMFDACFRIQLEACAAAGRHIPLIVENVRGAERWVGRARWAYGSFMLWGDVPALMPMTKAIKVPGFRFDGSGASFQSASVDHVKATNPGENGVKNKDADGCDRHHPHAFGWKCPRTSSHSNVRKAASAMIAKIPLPLSRYIARHFYTAK